MTPGGDLKAAMSIENAMGLIRSRVNTYAFSDCSSGGAMLLAAGTGKRSAFRGAMIVVHGMKIDDNLAKEHKDYVDGLQAYYTAFWQQRARLPAQWLPIPLNTLHCLTAEQALEYGLIDTIIERQPTIAEFESAANRSPTCSSETGRTPASGCLPPLTCHSKSCAQRLIKSTNPARLGWLRSTAAAIPMHGRAPLSLCTPA
jgi:hypothetical protein